MGGVLARDREGRVRYETEHLSMNRRLLITSIATFAAPPVFAQTNAPSASGRLPWLPPDRSTSRTR
jgi:hypothetical protein